MVNNLPVVATDILSVGGTMLPWETSSSLVEARRRFEEDDEDEQFGDYDFEENEDLDEEGDEDEDLDEEEDDEDYEEYDDLEEEFDDDEGGPRPPKRKKEWD